MTTEAPYLVLETDGAKRFPLQDPTTLGRLPGNVLPLEDPGCSGRHAVIRKDAGRWLLEDLGSTNGTWVNGQQLEKPYQLKVEDRIQVGAQLLRVGSLGSSCKRCGQELPGAAVFCPGCGLPVAPPALTPKAPVPPPLPLAIPPPLPTAPPPPVPVAPVKKKGGCWLSCGLLALVLLLLGGVATWFLWHRFFDTGASPLLGKALQFRQAARFDTPKAVVDWTEPKVQDRFQALNENLWPAVNPGLGWAFFFETSVVASGASSEGSLPVLFYNPWADVALVTVWNPGGRMSDAEIIAGDSLRREGAAPYGGGRGWLTQGSYGPAAVGGLTARTLLAFEKTFRSSPWTAANLRQPYPAWQDAKALEASSLACGLQFAQTFQELVAFSSGAEGAVRRAYVELLRRGAAGQAGALLAGAPGSSEASAEALKALPRERWSAFKVASFTDLGDRVLVMAHHSEIPDLFLGVVLERTAGGFSPQRIDCLSFTACYNATQ